MPNTQIAAPLSMSFHQHMREKLLKQIPEHSVVIVAAAQEQYRSRDGTYPFRQNSDFYYLTGFPEPDAILVLKKNAQNEYILFVNPKDPLQEKWQGRRFGIEGAQEKFGAHRSFERTNLTKELPLLLSNCDNVFYSFSNHHQLAPLIQDAFKEIQRKYRNHQHILPQHLHNLDPILHQQRLIKADEEIHIMRSAAKISVEAHLQAMAITKEGLYEYQLASQIHYHFANHNAQAAYETIVGSGENGCILHYRENQDQLKNGDLVLIDAGAELHGYSADITHTFPVSGKFSAEQQAIYDIVLAALNEAQQQLTTEHYYPDFHKKALEVLTQGLIDLKFIPYHLEEALEKKLYLPFYMHGTGHFLGRDTHDVGDYVEKDGTDLKLKKNMVITCEPGLYIPILDNIPPAFHNIGIRLENDIRIDQAPENLTHALPRSPNDFLYLIGSGL